jgi:hypothetical protein
VSILMVGMLVPQTGSGPSESPIRHVKLIRLQKPARWLYLRVVRLEERQIRDSLLPELH